METFIDVFSGQRCNVCVSSIRSIFLSVFTREKKNLTLKKGLVEHVQISVDIHNKNRVARIVRENFSGAVIHTA